MQRYYHYIQWDGTAMKCGYCKFFREYDDGGHCTLDRAPVEFDDSACPKQESHQGGRI